VEIFSPEEVDQQAGREKVNKRRKTGSRVNLRKLKKKKKRENSKRGGDAHLAVITPTMRCPDLVTITHSEKSCANRESGDGVKGVGEKGGRTQSDAKKKKCKSGPVSKGQVRSNS